MTKYYWTIVVALVTMSGCRHTCCQKKPCNTCTAPPVPYVGSAAPAQTPEILFPNPLPTTSTPTAPLPALPPDPPRSSGYAVPPDPATHIANSSPLPAIRLEAPEFSDPTHPGTTMSLKASEASRFGGQPAHVAVAVVSDHLRTGLKPSLDDLDRLSAVGVRRIVMIGDSSTMTASEMRVYELRGLEVSTIPAASSHGFAQVSALSKRDKIYVCGADRKTLRNWWRQYFRDEELLSDDAAQVRADRIASGG